MDKKTFAETRHKIEEYVASHRLHDALSYARSLAAAVDDRSVGQQLNRLEEHYCMMLGYAARGAEDPTRQEMVETTADEIRGVIDTLERTNLLPTESTIYFNTLRFENLRPSDSIASLIERYIALEANTSIFNVAESGNSDARQNSLNREELQRRLFNRIWVTHPLAGADAEAIAAAVHDERLTPDVKELMAWALMLGALHYPDSRRVELLADFYNSTNVRISSAGLIGLCLALNAFKNRKLSRAAKLKLESLRDQPQWAEHLRMANMELVKTIDTDRITAKIRDEVVPQMLKLKPEIDKKLRMKTDEFDPSELEENPDWQEMLEKSGIADRLKEMTEIQLEGGDVMMGTFAHLKSFPFFNDVANWFLPFNVEYSAFSADNGAAQRVGELMEMSAFLCDSDKYSMMFSLAHIPGEQQRIMLQQFQANEQQMAQMRAEALPVANSDRKNIVNKQIQNLFRFFSLYRRKGELPNPFAAGVNLAAIGHFDRELADEATLKLIAEFYLSHGYYAPALRTFNLLPDLAADASIYQKMGYASQKLGDYEQAVSHYRRAEMLDGGSDWTLRRLARCYMALHRPADALEALQELDRRNKPDARIALNIGRCLVELGRYDEAVAAFYKAEYLDDDKHKRALRPLAWCLLLSGDLPASRKYFEKIITETAPTPEDYLNMGHLSLAEGNFREAMNFYSLNISARGMEGATGTLRKEAIEGFIADMEADGHYLSRIGVDPSLVPLLTDAILYENNL